MKTRYNPINYVLLVLAVSMAGLLFVVPSSPAHAAELTTWQKFIKKKCGDLTADAAERCATNLETQLAKPVDRGGCGPEKETDTYIKCWRKFIRDNGGTAGPDSSPFEKEEAPEIEEAEGCAGIKTSLVDCTNTGGNPIISFLLQIVNFLAVGVGIAVVGGVIWGGLVYASSNGDANKVQQAKTIIVNAIVGLLLFFFMYAFVNYLVPGGLFN